MNMSARRGGHPSDRMARTRGRATHASGDAARGRPGQIRPARRCEEYKRDRDAALRRSRMRVEHDPQRDRVQPRDPRQARRSTASPRQAPASIAVITVLPGSRSNLPTRSSQSSRRPRARSPCRWRQLQPRPPRDPHYPPRTRRPPPALAGGAPAGPAVPSTVPAGIAAQRGAHVRPYTPSDSARARLSHRPCPV
jgi:hypothetical protein